MDMPSQLLILRREMFSPSVQFPPPPDLTRHITRIKDQYSAGGAFGDVYKCLYHGGSEPKEVAVKAFRFGFASDDSAKKSTQASSASKPKMLRRELGIWRRLEHDNIVPFLGIAYGFGMDGAMSLVSSWMPNESLEKFLTIYDSNLNVRHRLQFLLDIASGLNYLHSFQVPVVHGDLNCNNVFLDADYSARLADFGYASVVGNIPEALAYLQRSTARLGALRWVAPEQIDLEGTYTRTTKSDIYSFGCICLQVLSGKHPWSEIKEDAAIVLRLAMGHTPGRPESRILDDAHWMLIQRCWSPMAERPDAQVIISTIQSFFGDSPPPLSLRDAVMTWSNQANRPSDEDDQNEHVECLCSSWNNTDNAVRTLRNANFYSENGDAAATDPNAVAMQGEARSWEDALKDADMAIEVNPLSSRGYEEKHAALHALRRYDEAIEAFARMLAIIEESRDPDVRRTRSKYVSPAKSKMVIEGTLYNVFKTAPLVLIDVQSGRLCDGQQRMDIFKLEPQFKELVSSSTRIVDDERIHQVVAEYFQYVMLSHVWEGKEPLSQDVVLAGSVWDLDSSPLNKKLKRFCEMVREGEYRWGWTDSSCIDRSIGAVLTQSVRMMYKWYEGSAATYIYLGDVESPSVLGGLTDSIWMTRAWTAQELLVPKVIRFYDRKWRLYLGDTRQNHKESPEIVQELADAMHIARKTLITFHPDDVSVREKLQIASNRNATMEEDIAYSLMGIFKSDIVPNYGEGNDALGHLLEETVARSGDVTVLDWIGRSLPYNSCLPIALAVYSQPPYPLPVIGDAEMGVRAAALSATLSEEEAISFYTQVINLPPARFANRRLHLPSIIFAVKKLRNQDLGSGTGYRYRARVSGIGDVEFETSEKLSETEPRRLIFIHPWIRDLRDPLAMLTWASAADDEYDSDWEDAFESASESKYASAEDEAGSMPASPRSHGTTVLGPVTAMDDYTRALRLVVRLQRPFHGLLLQQQPNGEFRRVAAECAIVVPGIDRSIHLGRDVRAGVVEVL